jgi:hypothetical protein
MLPNKFRPIQLARATHIGQSTGPKSICLMKPVDIWSLGEIRFRCHNLIIKSYSVQGISVVMAPGLVLLT